MTDGEVAVRQHGQEHAISASRLDGQILADLDGETPAVQIPADVNVTYHDSPEDDIVTDGAGIERTEVEMRGFALPEEISRWALVVAGVLHVAGGALFGTGSSMTGFAALAGGAFLGYIGSRSAWSDRS
jgi:hypothetical protein